ncbi:unnamed protein product [Schistocephalus solidus]|uniref:Transposase n=1 Tax=Schistocephalus solidus TaxID=70667 RepID=A0A183TKF4_SCHSO|nr:unnamed protein product [Schistocephalus solidus]
MARQDPGHGSPGADRNPQHHAMLTQVQLRWSGYLVRMDDERLITMLRQVDLRWIGHLGRMDDERLPKGLFYGFSPTGRSKTTLQGHFKKSLPAT